MALVHTRANVETHNNLADARSDQAATGRRQAQGPEGRAIDSALRRRRIEQGEVAETKSGPADCISSRQALTHIGGIDSHAR